MASLANNNADTQLPLLLDEPQRPSSIFCCFFSSPSSSTYNNNHHHHNNNNNNRTSHVDTITTENGPIIVSKLPINQKSINRHRASFYSRLGVHVDGPPPESREDKPEELLNDIRSPVLRGGPSVNDKRYIQYQFFIRLYSNNI